MTRTHHRSMFVGTALATMALTLSSLGVSAQDASPAASGAPAAAAAGVPDGPDRLHRAGPGARRRQAVHRQARHDPDPVDRRRGRQLRRRRRRLRGGDRHRDHDRQGIGQPRDRCVNDSIEGGAAGPRMLAQPTAVCSTARTARSRTSRTFMDTPKLSAEHPATIGLHDAGRNIWGIPYKADVKSTIWYPIKAFEAAGYAVPTTWDELDRPVRQDRRRRQQPVVRQRRRPRHATGWQHHRLGRGRHPQDRRASSTTTQWISHELPFNSTRGSRPPSTLRRQDLLHARATSTAAARRSWRRRPDRRRWTRCSTRTWRRPTCWMQKSPDLVRPGLLPGSAGTSGDRQSKYIIGEDIGIFSVPDHRPGAQSNAEGSAPATRSWSLADRPEVRAVAAVPGHAGGPSRRGSRRRQRHLAQHDDPGRVVRRQLQARRSRPRSSNNATAIGFDASDLMPPAVGAGTFWTGTVDWVNSRWHQHRRRPAGHRRQLADQ